MAKEAISVTEGMQRLWNIARESRIPGLTYDCERELSNEAVPSQILGSGFRLRWERGWAVDVKLAVVTDIREGALCLRVEVGWSSSGLSASRARAAAVLQSQVADLACWMESAIESMPPLKTDKEGA